MRAIGLLALFAVPAGAEPNPETLPDVVKESIDSIWDRPLANRQGEVGIDGALASGIVITPPLHADAVPWPEGAIMRPPDINDPMALELGTKQLRTRDKREPWLPRDLSRSFGRGLDNVWDLVLPKL